MRSLTNLSDTLSFPKGEGDQTCFNEAEGKNTPHETAKAPFLAFGWLAPLMLVLFLAGLHAGGFFDRARVFTSDFAESYFVSAGIVLKKIHIKGQVTLSDEQVIEALGIRSGQSLFGFDAAAAQKRLSLLGQVKTARVMRLLPSKLLVEIEERRPFVRWMHDGRIELIDKDGIVLRTLAGEEQADTPLVVGAGAGQKAAELIRILSTHPVFATHLKMAERVGQYRWNLHAKSGAVIKLPPTDLALGVARFVSLPDWQALLTRKNMVIDLRQASQAFVHVQVPRKSPVPSRF